MRCKKFFHLVSSRTVLHCDVPVYAHGGEKEDSSVVIQILYCLTHFASDYKIISRVITSCYRTISVKLTASKYPRVPKLLDGKERQDEEKCAIR